MLFPYRQSANFNVQISIFRYLVFNYCNFQVFTEMFGYYVLFYMCVLFTLWEMNKINQSININIYYPQHTSSILQHTCNATATAFTIKSFTDTLIPSSAKNNEEIYIIKAM